MIELHGMVFESRWYGIWDINFEKYFLLLVYSTSEIMFAGTPGKLLLGLKIYNANGGAASYLQLTKRWLIKHLSVLLAVVGGGVLKLASAISLGPITGDHLAYSWLYVPCILLSAIIAFGYFLALDERRQALHDRLCMVAVFRGKLEKSSS